MRNANRRAIGWSLIVLGLCIVVLSQKIVVPGFEALFGIEAIVGSENVVYEPDGSYLFTNPSAIIRWVASIAALGLLFVCTGGWLLFLNRRGRSG